ncbi:uncharacterized protein EKO05_0009265 [Ascochyta rabiei]|uniref:Uncharacterized protein n=1 Tax=Didymella rabiei TaxID=5454 RepID=A0A163EWF6_DIDRA|nr:uncharacterized protein EKO05_0009265 [Ascochyta rabiei]KZM23972.1 hypothetical protein ST47_g4845 [Ascochyta rabiei]UPX18987.1 hypothetical protein EKO05_0009265 [Ascochyta rabiei]
MAAPGGMPPSMANMKPPYPPMAWALGGAPVKKVDIPAQTIFMIFFMIGAAVHMTIFQKNRARGHKFLFNIFFFSFCVSRAVASILRIASTAQPQNVKLAMAASIFVAAGVLVLFIINLIFAMRLVRSLHPSLGWHPLFGIIFKLLCVLTGATIITVIAGTLQSFYVLDPNTKAIDRSLQIYGSTFLAIIATLPLPITVLSLLIPYSPPDRFGVGRLRTKVIMLLISTTLLSIGAWYRCGCTWAPPVPRSQPLPGYLGKGAFYISTFFVEVQTVLMYAILRVDLRYHIPNGAQGSGSYSSSQQLDDVEMQDSRPTSASKTIVDSDSETASKNTLTIGLTINTNIPTIQIHDPEKTPAFSPDSPDTYIASTQTTPATSPTSPLKNKRKSLLQSLFKRQSKAPTLPPIQPDISPLEPPPMADQKLRWRDSEQRRIITRLGGPWQELDSPTSPINPPSPTSTIHSFRTSISTNTRGSVGGISVGTGLSLGVPSVVTAPSLRDTLRADGGWTPELDWELRSPRRFLSMKRRVTGE